MTEDTGHDIVDAEVITDDPPATPAVTQAIVPTQPTAVLRPLVTPDEASEMMGEYQRMVRAVLDDSDYQQAERGKRFVKKSGWRKLAKAYGVSVTIQSIDVERDTDGHATRATVVVRAAAPTGQISDGDGYCSADESRFQRSGGRKKLENDLRATATTRAKNRAISDLIGMGEVSAEEAAVMGGHVSQPAAYAGDITELTALLTGLVSDSATAARITDWIRQDNDGIIPASVARTLIAVARAAAASHTTGDDQA